MQDLDENGIVRIGSVVKGGDILVGKITPKSEGELTPEEKLIQAIFAVSYTHLDVYKRQIYIHKLFEDINPIQDIAGEKHVIEIDEVEISSPLHDIDVCKKKELTYGGVISAKVKLIDSVSKKVLFSKKANVGIMPIITPNLSLIHI